ncbi:transcription factor bHLH154-like isoform X1 [Impatiens glandulifera]|uniref:transcription factor bHLH154-like isoform X1 n=1 Tax=Impatiens glandulifera TaxID=253017 RepID=UPI001FB0BE0D|nr:transcription factor bHLH154-like isoform X1 [Impatiens glandulifera]XP_047317861.1 transcription factor bHLH154-like isoform X1 [Impatiens glandulifera]
MERKRSPISIEQGHLASFVPKRSKPDDLCNSSKERKENLGAKISTLQQLVSPFGKTDTASVLHEAMEYITFLHDQVKVLSSPYLQSNPIPMNKLQEGDDELYNLRSKGLCLVPITYAAGIAGSNGADIWAPIKTTTTTSRY